MDSDASSSRSRSRERRTRHEGRTDRKRRRDDEVTDKPRHHQNPSSRERGRRDRSRSPDSRRRRSRERGSGKDRYGDREQRRKRSSSPTDRPSRAHRDGSHGRKDENRLSRRRRDEPSDSRDVRSSDDRRRRRRDSPSPDEAPSAPTRRSGPLPSQDASFAISKGEEPEKPKEKPNMGNTGLLAAVSNQVTQADGSTTTLKYHEPPEGRKPAPRDAWRLFVFKGSEVVDTIELAGRSCWLVGRETAVVDLLAEHPSISKQHAVLQFRYTEKRNEFGDRIGRVKPYLIDLESANGTMLNGERVPDSRYLELRSKDVVKFGQSTREYVVMLPPRD